MSEPAPTSERIVDVALLLFVLSAGLSTTASQTAAYLAIVAWVYGAARGRGFSGRLPVLRPHLVLAAVTLVAVFAAADIWAGLMAIRSEWSHYALMVVAADRLSDPSRRRALTTVWILAGVGMALVGLAQTLREGVAYRVHGFMNGYATYSVILMLTLMVLGARALFDAPPRRAWLWLPACGLICTALLMTQTRGAWLGTVAGAAVLIWYRDRRFLLLLPVLVAAALLLAPDPVQARLRGLTDLSDVTANERIFAWRAGAVIVRNHPLTGVGPGNVVAAWREYRLPDDPWLDRNPWLHMHSNVMQLLSERGIPGLLAWLWIWVAWFGAAYRARSDVEGRPTWFWVAGVAATVAFLVVGLTDCAYGRSEMAYRAYFLMALPLTGSLRGDGET